MKNQKQKNDNRMAWIRNLEKLSKKGITTYCQEYELASECRIPGVLNYTNQKIVCGGFSLEKDRDGLYRYLLRIEYFEYDQNYNENANKQGYYSPEGMLGELLSLFSLYFQCRFYLVTTYRGELTNHGLKTKLDHRFLHKPTPKAVHPKIFTDGGRNFAKGLADFLDSIKKVDESKHQRLILACYHYLRSLKEVGIDSEMVFIRLVSAIEALSGGTKLTKKDDPFHGKKLANFIKDGTLSMEQLKELENTFDNRKSRMKFIRFVEKYCKGAFKGGKWKAKHAKIKREALPKVLKTIYDARSNYLHNGEPMYLSHFMHGADKWDTDVTFGMIIDNRQFSASQKLPFTYWFENIVRCCLLNYIKE